jgi:hypothetical protein
MRTYVHISISFALALLLVLPRPIPDAMADDARDQETMNELAALLANGLATESFDLASVAAWKEVITDLTAKGETLQAKRVAWLLLFHPRSRGRRAGARALIGMYDHSDPQEVGGLVALDNDCVRTAFVDLAEDGYLSEYPIAPQLAELLVDERFLRRNRQGRLVYTLRALYHYSDKSVVSKVADYLDDPNERVKEVSARTLGKLTGHTFSKTGDMDFTPKSYYITKARVWWFMNKGRPEYGSVEKPRKRRYHAPELTKQTPEKVLRVQVAHLQNKDFLVWTTTFSKLLELGVEHDSSTLTALLEDAPVNQVDAVYTRTLARLVEFYNKKRETMSDYKYGKHYDIKKFCFGWHPY